MSSTETTPSDGRADIPQELNHITALYVHFLSFINTSISATVLSHYPPNPFFVYNTNLFLLG